MTAIDWKAERVYRTFWMLGITAVLYVLWHVL